MPGYCHSSGRSQFSNPGLLLRLCRDERRQHDTSLRIRQKKWKTIIITVKIQLRLSWEHLISLWKFYVNQMPAWPCARSQGGCAILHSNELPQKTQQLLQKTGPKHNIAQKSEAHAAYFRAAFIFYPTMAIKVINNPPFIIPNTLLLLFSKKPRC